ncbi:hypothetical protein [Agrobacterium vitis]|uniref:hypothetical protein n=1 Tax=Agrobacterium vitis TaxID=373 RepID=UPI001F373CF2|nr:hypothetical protein [Agrobacterium vitis]MCF1453415.1 hypothetical protein [Agrobacterium vitis]
MIGVSPGRVSQYLTEGKISPAALDGVGRNAKINVERAKADLRLTLDVSQRLGNGIDTRLDAAGQVEATTNSASANYQTPQPLQVGGIDYEIKQQKLNDLKRRNRNAAIADAEGKGQLMQTDEARAEMARVASSMLLVFEGGLVDLAAAVASEFQVPHRDVVHLMRKEFRKIRENAAKQMSKQVQSMQETIETTLDAEEIDSDTLN